MARLLLAYDTVEGQTRKIAEHMAQLATQRGHDISLVPITDVPADCEPLDGAILGASIHVGRHSRRFTDFVQKQLGWLDSMPVAFFSVSLSASGPTEEREQAMGYVRALLSETGWRPQATAIIGGGLPYRRYGFLKRLFMRKIAREGGRDTDTSRNHEYTDWAAVDQFTRLFLDQFDRP